MLNKTIALSSKASSLLTTPQLLKVGLYLTWCASLLLLFATLSGAQGHRHSLKTVGKDAAPSIIAAQHIKAGLADMNANAADELLVKPEQNSDAVNAYEARRQEVTKALVAAAENITYGDAERIPIQTLQMALGDYEAKIQQARDFHARADNGSIVAYRAATDIMNKMLLPAANALDQANLEALERTYTDQKAASLVSLSFVLVSGLVLIGVLVAIQLFLNHRLRRIFNPMLLAATAISIIFLGYTTRAFLSGSHNLKVAKEDAFTSIHALWQARAVAYSANGDESRYLFDATNATAHEQAFLNKVAKLATLPQGQTFETVAAASAQGIKVNGFTGYLADELNNITFKGERKAAVTTLTTFSTYLALDQQIRHLQLIGNHQDAITLCTSKNKGESNWAFNQFDQALDKTLEINQQAFNKAIEQGFNNVDGFEITTPFVAVTVSLLTLFGLLPRLQEYSK